MIPTCGYRNRQEAIAAMDGAGMSRQQIAERIGVKVGTVNVVLHYIRIGRRRITANGRTIVVPRDVLDRLQTDAVARGLSVNALVRLLLDHVVDEDLVGAILDDGGDYA
jgi:hypothetical protein